MRWQKPWWMYWRGKDRNAVRLIHVMEGKNLYCMVQVDPDTGRHILLNSVEPTGYGPW